MCVCIYVCVSVSLCLYVRMVVNTDVNLMLWSVVEAGLSEIARLRMCV